MSRQPITGTWKTLRDTVVGMDEAPYVIILGIMQDGGYPQASCQAKCCARAWDDPDRQRLVSCLGIVEPGSGRRWLIDATPDFKVQLHRLSRAIPPAINCDGSADPTLNGIFLTHAHIGHYTGLIHVGREAASFDHLPVYAMQRMRTFLESNAPWSQLVDDRHISLQDLQDRVPVVLSDRLSVTPLLVPHRDEYSETVGYVVRGPTRAALYLPDIDRWDLWPHAIEDVIESVAVAFVDGTFYDASELPGRDLSTIPHPPVTETVARLASLADSECEKVHFIHLNHTNPLLHSESHQRQLQSAGFKVAREGARYSL